MLHVIIHCHAVALSAPAGLQSNISCQVDIPPYIIVKFCGQTYRGHELAAHPKINILQSSSNFHNQIGAPFQHTVIQQLDTMVQSYMGRTGQRICSASAHTAAIAHGRDTGQGNLVDLPLTAYPLHKASSGRNGRPAQAMVRQWPS